MPWVAAALAGGSLAWAAPRAVEAGRLQGDSVALRRELNTAHLSLLRARENMEALAARLQDALDESARLAKLERKNDQRIKELLTEVRELEAAYAASLAEAAAEADAAAEASPAPATSGSLPPVMPLPEPKSCYAMIDPETGETKKVCD